MASVEQLKTFEETAQAEVLLRDKYQKQMNNVTKMEAKLEKLKAELQEARLEWEEWQAKKSQQFDELLHTVQNL